MIAFQSKVEGAGSHLYVPQEAYNSLVSAYSGEPRAPRTLARYTFGDGFPQTDYGNAERLVARHGENVRYCGPWKRCSSGMGSVGAGMTRGNRTPG